VHCVDIQESYDEKPFVFEQIQMPL